MTREHAIARIRAAVSGARADALIAALQPSVRFRARRDPSVAEAAVSRLGGASSLARGQVWPRWDGTRHHQGLIELTQRRIAESRRFGLAEQRRLADYRAALLRSPLPLSFLGQIRLSELAGTARVLGLPEEGMLVFFRDMTTELSGASADGLLVQHVRDEDIETVRAPPSDAAFDVDPCSLSFSLEYTLPRQVDGEEGDAVREVPSVLSVGDDADPCHRVGGHPDAIQDDPRACCAELAGGAANDWRLLLQLDTDEAGPGWMWADCGRLYICVRAAHWQEGRFDRAIGVVQSS